MHQKFWLHDIQFLIYGAWRTEWQRDRPTDGWTDGKSDIKRWVPQLKSYTKAGKNWNKTCRAKITHDCIKKLLTDGKSRLDTCISLYELLNAILTQPDRGKFNIKLKYHIIQTCINLNCAWIVSLLIFYWMVIKISYYWF